MAEQRERSIGRETLEGSREIKADEVVRVVEAENWERRSRRGSLADFFAASPLRKSGLVVERSQSKD